jgi:hypothetical protein
VFGLTLGLDLDGRLKRTTMRTAANAAAASAVSDTNLPDGELIYVATFRDYFSLSKTSTATPDGKTVLATLSGTGRWERLCIPHPSWARQGTWVLNATTGNDENTGIDSAHAIQTHNEKRRRWGNEVRFKVPVVETWEGSFPVTDLINGKVIVDEGGAYTINGTPTVVRSGTLTAVAAINRTAGASAALQITDGSVNWAADVDRQVIITAGARAGMACYVVKSVSAGVARCSPLTLGASGDFASPSLATPVAGDAYSVRTLATAYVGQFEVVNAQSDYASGGVFTVNHAAFLGLTFGLKGRFKTNNIAGGINHCTFNGLRLNGDRVMKYNGCLLDSTCVAGLIVFSGASKNQGLYLDSRDIGVTLVDFDHISQGAPIGCSTFAQLVIGNACAFDSYGPGLDMNFKSSVILCSGFQGGHSFYGTNNASYGVKLAKSASMAVESTMPVCNSGLGAAREARVGSVDKLYSALPFLDATTQCFIALSP